MVNRIPNEPITTPRTHRVKVVAELLEQLEQQPVTGNWTVYATKEPDGDYELHITVHHENAK